MGEAVAPAVGTVGGLDRLLGDLPGLTLLRRQKSGCFRGEAVQMPHEHSFPDVAAAVCCMGYSWAYASSGGAPRSGWLAELRRAERLARFALQEDQDWSFKLLLL